MNVAHPENFVLGDQLLRAKPPIWVGHYIMQTPATHLQKGASFRAGPSPLARLKRRTSILVDAVVVANVACPQHAARIRCT